MEGLSFSRSPNHNALSAGYRTVGYTAFFEVVPESVRGSVGMGKTSIGVYSIELFL